MNSQLHSHESMLKESIKHFLSSYHNGSSDFSSLEFIFFRLIQTMLDSPLEITWFYSAVTFHASRSGFKTNHTSARVIRAKDLLNLLVSCSHLSNAPKKIALLAPVVYELYNIVLDCREDSLSVHMEVQKLVDSVTSHIVVCAGLYESGNGAAEYDCLVVCFEDLVRVWMADRDGGSSDFEDNLRGFFPILTDGLCKGIDANCGIRKLVGIVMCQVFFLRLHLSFCSAMHEENSLKDIAVKTIEVFRNFDFLDMLLKTLLEPALPIANLLSDRNKVILRKVLYDAVMIEYSFYSGRWDQSPDCEYQHKQLAVHWVLVVNRAIELARDTADHKRTSSYLLSFHGSPLVSGLVNWASVQAGMIGQTDRRDISTPMDLIHWLLILQHQGIKVFDHGSSLPHAIEALARKVKSNGTLLRLDQENPNNFGSVQQGSRKRKGNLEEPQVKHAKLEEDVQIISDDDEMELVD